MVICHDRLLVAKIDRFAKNHHSFPNILDNHFDIANLHDIIGCSLHWIHLHGLQLILLPFDANILALEDETTPVFGETGLTGHRPV